MAAPLRIVRTADAPAAIGPYSQGIIAGGMVYTAGQVALDPATGALIDGDVAAQTERALRNLTAVLEAAGVSWNQVVRTTVYLRHMGDFPVVNDVYARVLGDARPARSTIEVAGLPRGALVEIDAVATTAT